jgi:uncharacterized protein
MPSHNGKLLNSIRSLAMSAYEHDYPDHTQSPDFAHGDERPSNTSANRNFYDVVEARTSRRGFVLGSLAALATGLYAAPVVSAKRALADSTSASTLLGFKPVPVAVDDR